MHVIRANNVHTALPEAIDLLLREGDRSESRNGLVLRMSEPVTTVYRFPRQRVLFWADRDANPFFHLMEALWMLAGRQDVAFPAQFAKQLKEYSDDGTTFHAAYGYRWREHFGVDQLVHLIDHLANNPDSRRAVIVIADPRSDIPMTDKGKDLPCNLVAHFRQKDGILDMTVFCRSNDIIWGCYGANAVHFSILQEFVAEALHLKIGQYWQVSDDWHGYLKTLDPVRHLAEFRNDSYRSTPDPYANVEVVPFRLVNTPFISWLRDLQLFMEDPFSNGFSDEFFTKVAKPMFCAFKAHKGKDHQQSLEILSQMPVKNDWRKACEQWIGRRQKHASA